MRLLLTISLATTWFTYSCQQPMEPRDASQVDPNTGDQHPLTPIPTVTPTPTVTDNDKGLQNGDTYEHVVRLRNYFEVRLTTAGKTVDGVTIAKFTFKSLRKIEDPAVNWSWGIPRAAFTSVSLRFSQHDFTLHDPMNRADYVKITKTENEGDS